MIEIIIKHQIFTSSGKQFLEIKEFFQNGSFVHVSGESGIGKSTFFRILAGLIKPDFGFVKINDVVILDTENHIFLSPQQRDISIMFQNYALFPNMKVVQNIAFAQSVKNNDIINYYLDKFKLEALKDVYPTKLSGGQQQRVALARTLAQNAATVLLDEPLSAVDQTLRLLMMQEIAAVNKKQGSTIFMISHNKEELEGIDFITMIIK